MSVQDFLKTSMASSMPTFGSETVTIGSESVQAIIDETERSNPLTAGAKSEERTLVIQFPSSSYARQIRSGDRVHARGKDWKVSPEDGSVRKGQIATTLTLVEPERRREF